MKPSGVEWIGDIPESWTKDKLFRLTDFVSSGGTPTSTNPDYYEDGDITWIQTGDLNDGYISETSKKITQYGLDNSSAKIFNQGTLLIAMYGATIGKLGIMAVDAATNQACCAMKYNDKTDTKFMFYIFLAMKTHLINQSYGGGQPNISQDVVKQQYLCFPKYYEQKLIANFLDKSTSQIEDAIKTKQAQLKTLETLKKSIIHKAVTKGLDDSVAMKDSGIEWIGKIPEHWKIVRVKDDLEFFTGKTPDTTNGEHYLGSNKWITIRDLGELYITDTKQYISDEYIKESKIRIAPKGSLLFSFKLTVGTVALIEEPMYTNEAIAIFPPNTKTITKYLYYSFGLYLKENAKTNIYGAALMNRDIIKGSKYLLPSKIEQHNIVCYLDEEIGKVEILEQNVKKQVYKLKEYKKSLIYEYVTGKKQVKE